MTGKRRSLVTAILATLSALGFAFTLIALAGDIDTTIEHGESTEGATFTFVKYQCIETSNELQHCGWFGTVSANGVVEAQDVEFRSSTRPDVESGDQIQALWSYRDPLNAWTIEGSRAWLNTIGSAVVSFAFMLVMVAASIYWWRRFARDTKVPTDGSKAPQPKRTQDENKERVAG